jgi:hypothetical protein
MSSTRLLSLVVGAGLSGCSLIYDADELRNRPDAIPIDADPSMLDLVGTEPLEIHEGTGADGGRPAVILIDGSSIVSSAEATVEYLGADGELIAELEVLGFIGARDLAAVAVAIPVGDELGAGDLGTLRITVSQAGVDDLVAVDVLGLDQLALPGGPVLTEGLAPLYARIDVAGAVTFEGGEVALHATGGISIAEVLSVDAFELDGGAGGCAGGDVQEPGSCGSSGGGEGTNDNLTDPAGGGGGGFAETGGNGTGEGGDGGVATGNPMLVPLGADGGNRGNGGGGGHGGLLTGRRGGGGGGVIDITAGGDITVTAAGAVSAAGAAGAGGSGGDGGGGSGGAILVRAGGAIVASGAWLSAPGGAGGEGGATGGDGSPGRIRVDAPVGEVDEMATDPEPAQGPAWHPDTPFLVEEAEQDLILVGEPGRTYGVRSSDVIVTDVTPGGGGTATVPVTLERGRNRICAAYTLNAEALDLDEPEAQNCVDIVYLK